MVGLAACLGLSPVGASLALAAQDNVMAAEPPGEDGGDEAEFAAEDDAGLTAGWEEDEDGSLSDEDGDAGEEPAFADDDAGLTADDSAGEGEIVPEDEAPDAGQTEAAGEASSADAEQGEIALRDDDGGSRAKTGPGQ